jgi:hypothetical protein
MHEERRGLPAMQTIVLTAGIALVLASRSQKLRP